ncbi:hypothetical protein V8E54_013798 [Elaphomyces granulatus]|jgi:hypothetical protein
MSTTDIRFVFGHNDSFFLDTPKAWDWKNLPKECEKVFNACTIKADQIQQVYWVALGESDAYMVYGLKADKRVWIWSRGPNTDYLYDLTKRAASDRTKTVFGANGSYYIIQPSSFNYSGISRELEKKRLAVEADNDTITEVALGWEDRYICLTKAGLCHWLLTHGTTLWNILEENGTPRKIAHISLNPWNDAHYSITFTDGSARFCVPESWLAQIKAVLDATGVKYSYETTS